MKRKSTKFQEGILVPNHLAIICDGNRRWARSRNLPNIMGHQSGFNITPKIGQICRNLGINTLTFWAFSTENWDRPKNEIDFLMKKYEEFVDQHLKEAKKDKVRIVHLGRKDRLPKSLVKKITRAEKETKDNRKYYLNIALDYGGRDEILRATQKIIKDGIKPEKVDEKLFACYMDTKDQPYPYPDLLIRPSGEQRTSGMFAWQMAYAETYWLPDHFPDLDEERIKEAVIDYSKRRRRFGGNDDIPKVKFDPKRIAQLEVGWWQAHHQNNQSSLLNLLTEYLVQLYDLNKSELKEIVQYLIQAVKYHNQKSWLKAQKMAVKAYRILKEKTGYAFTPEIAAQLEINYWEVHDQLEKVLDKAKLEKAFRDLYGEIYRLSDFQATKVAHFKTLATRAHDLAEESQPGKEEKRYWHLAEEYLTKAYQALRYVAS